MFTIIQKQQAASYEFPYSAFVFDTLEEAQDFGKECLSNQKIGIIAFDEYKNLSKLYLAAEPGSEERVRIINYLDKEVK